MLSQALLFWRKSCFLWLGPLIGKKPGGRGNLDSEGGALHFCKLAALKLPLPVTAHGTEGKRNITELRGGKEKQNQRQMGLGFNAQ